jgi:deazaflavin-dependent oxidoreductase (nitroreductase family)
MRRAILVGAAGLGGLVLWWRRHPRTGAGWVNRVVDPWLVRQGVFQDSNGELGLIEHVGRKSGIVRATPIHPVRTAEGFRIIAPLGLESHWVRNVLAAGHCRLEVDGVVHELDQPQLVVPSGIDGLPRLASWTMDGLGFRYLVLRRFSEHPGTLDSSTTATEVSLPELGAPAR